MDKGSVCRPGTELRKRICLGRRDFFGLGQLQLGINLPATNIDRARQFPEMARRWSRRIWRSVRNGIKGSRPVCRCFRPVRRTPSVVPGFAVARHLTNIVAALEVRSPSMGARVQGRGTMEIKGMGKVETWWLVSKIEPDS